MTDLHYIDTSYLAPYYLPEVRSEVVERRLLKLPVGSLVISPLVRSEFASLLSRKSRTKEMDGADARRTMTALDTHLAAGILRMCLKYLLGKKHISISYEVSVLILKTSCGSQIFQSFTSVAQNAPTVMILWVDRFSDQKGQHSFNTHHPRVVRVFLKYTPSVNCLHTDGRKIGEPLPAILERLGQRDVGRFDLYGQNRPVVPSNNEVDFLLIQSSHEQ